MIDWKVSMAMYSAWAAADFSSIDMVRRLQGSRLIPGSNMKYYFRKWKESEKTDNFFRW